MLGALVAVAVAVVVGLVAVAVVALLQLGRVAQGPLLGRPCSWWWEGGRGSGSVAGGGTAG